MKSPSHQETAVECRSRTRLSKLWSDYARFGQNLRRLGELCMTRRPWMPWSAERQGPYRSHLPFERKRYYPGLLAADPDVGHGRRRRVQSEKVRRSLTTTR